MTDTKDGLGIEEGTTGEATQTPMVQDAPEGAGVVTEILKSPWTLWLKKSKQAMGLVRMSPRNLWHNKLSMEEKAKAVTIETDEEEEDLQTLITTAKEEEDVEEDIQLLRSTAKRPAYVPPRIGKTKVPKDLDATKSSLQTPLLPMALYLRTCT